MHRHLFQIPVTPQPWESRPVEVAYVYLVQMLERLINKTRDLARSLMYQMDRQWGWQVWFSRLLEGTFPRFWHQFRRYSNGHTHQIRQTQTQVPTPLVYSSIWWIVEKQLNFNAVGVVIIWRGDCSWKRAESIADWRSWASCKSIAWPTFTKQIRRLLCGALPFLA